MREQVIIPRALDLSLSSLAPIKPVEVIASLGSDAIAVAGFQNQPPTEFALPAASDHRLMFFSAGYLSHTRFKFANLESMQDIRGGTLVLAPALESSEWSWKEGSGDAVHVLIPEKRLQQTVEQMERPRVSAELVPEFGREDESLRHLILALREEARSGGASGVLFVDSVLQAIQMRLLLSYGRPVAPEGEGRRGGLAPWRLKRVMEYIDANLGNEMGLAELAAVAMVSPFYFSRLFKQSTGQGPHAYVLSIKIRKAKEYLREGSLPLVEISNLLGFCNQAYFTTVFKQATGITPRRFQEESRR